MTSKLSNKNRWLGALGAKFIMVGSVLLLTLAVGCGRSEAGTEDLISGVLALSGNANALPLECLDSPCLSIGFREFTFQDEENGRIRAALRSLFGKAVLGSGEKLILKLKDADKNLLSCAPDEADCADGVRTYDKDNLLGDAIVVVTSTGFAKYMNLEIRDSGDNALYRTSGDLELNNDRENLLEVEISLYPTGQVGFSAEALQKKIEFELPLSETANDILKNADSGEIKGKFECAQPSNSSQSLNGYPLTIEFDHDASGKKLSSDAVELKELYVGSPCVLEVTSKEGGNIDRKSVV